MNNNIKKRDIDIGEINDFEKEREDYWSKIIAGDIKLENGEIFDDKNFYNKKYLKFEPEIIKNVLMAMALTVDDEEFKQKCKDKYNVRVCKKCHNVYCNDHDIVIKNGICSNCAPNNKN